MQTLVEELQVFCQSICKLTAEIGKMVEVGDKAGLIAKLEEQEYLIRQLQCSERELRSLSDVFGSEVKKAVEEIRPLVECIVRLAEVHSRVNKEELVSEFQRILSMN